MWYLLELAFCLVVVLLFFTEILIPILKDKPLFGTFKKTPTPLTFEEKIDDAKNKINEVKDIQAEADKKLKEAENIKKKTDKLL